MENKFRLIQEEMIRQSPSIKKEFEAHPHMLEKAFAKLGYEIKSKRRVYTWDDLPPKHKKIVLEDFHPQVDKLYSHLKKLWKRYRKGEDPIKQLHAAARDYVKEHPETFPSIKVEYLDDVDLFDWKKSKHDRRFNGVLLQLMIKDLTTFRINAAKLFDIVK